MGLILTRSPFFISNEGYGANAVASVDISRMVDGVLTAERSYELGFGTQSEIDVSPLINDFYTKEADILQVEIEVDGDIAPVPVFYFAVDGYGYYEDGYNLDLSAELYDKNFYAGSNDKIQVYADGLMNIPLLSAHLIADTPTTSIQFRNGDDVVPVSIYSLEDYISRVTFDGIYESNTCISDFISTTPIEEVGKFKDGFPSSMNLSNRIAYVSADLKGQKVDKMLIYTTTTYSSKSKVVEYDVEYIEECKYTPYRLRFRNRYGVLEDLWFFKRTNESLQTERKEFNRVTFDSYKVGDLSRHSLKQYNVNGKESIELNTGWVCESFYENIKQLMLSEEVYIEKNGVDLPINITDSEFRYKTHINDKVINYSINADFAYQKINNIV